MTSPSFYLWTDQTPRPGHANMAIDMALLDRAEQQGESWLRLYRWKPHCLSFGRHEPARRRYDVGRIQAQGLDTVRRPTGGRAVWHAQELTYAIASPTSRFGSLQTAYREIHRMLAAALGRLGLAASLAERRGAVALDAGACFSQPVGGEVMIAGHKAVGSAQLRRGTALLQHGSILLEDDQQLVAELTPGAASHPSAASLRATLGRPLSGLELASCVAWAAADRWSASWESVDNPGAILHAALAYFPQFQSPAWTWAR
jgi:lipoyl(octanoyl) transferase